MRRNRRRRGRRRGRPLFELFPKGVLGILAASLVISLFISRGVITVSSVRPLEGHVIFIDPGHGGIDPGACGEIYTEKEIVLKVALLLGDRLARSGAQVVYTRTGDYDLETPEVSDVQARINIMKQSKASVAISIHCNDFTDPWERGAQVFYNASKHPDSKRLAQLIQDEFAKHTDTEREISSRWTISSSITLKCLQLRWNWAFCPTLTRKSYSVLTGISKNSLRAYITRSLPFCLPSDILFPCYQCYHIGLGIALS